MVDELLLIVESIVDGSMLFFMSCSCVFLLIICWNVVIIFGQGCGLIGVSVIQVLVLEWFIQWWMVVFVVEFRVWLVFLMIFSFVLKRCIFFIVCGWVVVLCVFMQIVQFMLKWVVIVVVVMLFWLELVFVIMVERFMWWVSRYCLMVELVQLLLLKVRLLCFSMICVLLGRFGNVGILKSGVGCLMKWFSRCVSFV